ncbi:leucoanthocyanidin dioxygenase-like [Phragmites australis]|uniref:leucoanthocyanidin dioxygenase-like n=1 Tax=Phragmites australis TaxID=29695 RepID=UPI002D78C39C|nr:leucoanthocyanidin dioxygenase-like [Phragmites australis]
MAPSTMLQQPAPARVEALSLSGLSAIPPEYVRPADERADLGDAFDLARTHADDHPRIPVVDISPFITNKQQQQECVEAVRAAAAEWGVMHITGHGIPAELIDGLRAAGTAFFALPIQAKEAYANDPAAGRLQGYGSRLATNASGQREWEDYLFHLLHPDSLANHALWPAHPPEYVAATREFGHRVREVASRLLAILSLGLGLQNEDRLEKELTQTQTQTQTQAGEESGGAKAEDLLLQLKINYYPRCPQPELAVGVEAHTDVSALSFILHNGVPGLQVWHGGRWVTARSEPGTMIVHVGDALEILSNGRYTSVLHRGLVNREAVRVSWVVFCEPPPEAVLLRPLPELVTDAQSARFTPRTFKQHLDRKLFRKQQKLDGLEEHDHAID